MKRILGIVVLSLVLVSCIKNLSSIKQSNLKEGHLTDTVALHAFTYNLMTDNCHNVANEGVKVDPDAIGIVICSGEADKKIDLSGHTFNYKIKYLNQAKDKVDVDFYNWGQSKGCSNEKYPLDVNDSCINPIVKTFCMGSVRDYLMYYGYQNPRILPIGQKVEELTVEKCSEQTKDYTSCEHCCIEQANFWSVGDTQGYEEWKKLYEEYIKELSEYVGLDFVEYYKKRLDLVENESIDSKDAQEFLDELFQKVISTDEERADILTILVDYLTKKNPKEASMGLKYADQIEIFTEQCSKTCRTKYPMSKKDIQNLHNKACPLQK